MTRFSKVMKYAAAAAGALGLIAIAGPAFAAGPSGNETATVTVPSQLTLSLGQSSFSFGSGPGVLTSPPATVTITSNDQTGYNVMGQATAFNGGTSSAISSGALSVSSTLGSGTPQDFTFASDGGGAGSYSTAENAFQETGPSAAGGDTWTQVFSLDVPANQPPASYSATIMLTAVGQ
jgi:hypothetical protein